MTTSNGKEDFPRLFKLKSNDATCSTRNNEIKTSLMLWLKQNNPSIVQETPLFKVDIFQDLVDIYIEMSQHNASEAHLVKNNVYQVIEFLDTHYPSKPNEASWREAFESELLDFAQERSLAFDEMRAQIKASHDELFPKVHVPITKEAAEKHAKTLATLYNQLCPAFFLVL